MQISFRFPHTGLLLVSAVLTLFVAAAVGHASTAFETGDVCVVHYAGSTNCTANDVDIESVVVTEIVEGCHGPADTASVRLEVRFVNAAQPRFDVGIFLATDGGSALTGNECYHDYLAPPLSTSPAYVAGSDSRVELRDGPWPDEDGDACGDIEQMDDLGNPTRLITTLPSPSTSLTVACVDENNDGTVDVDVCASWDSNPLTPACTDVTGAYPITASKCRCDGRVELTGLLVGTATTTLPGATTTLAPSTTTTLPSATTTTLPASTIAAVPARIVTIKPGRVFKIVASGDFAGPSDDPTIDGATLSFTTATGGQTYTLPASCWTAGSDPSRGFVCNDEVCSTVRIKPGLLKAVCKFDTGNFTVPNDGDVDVLLSIGDTTLYCANCGGIAGGRPDTAYIRKECAAPATCP